MSNALFLWRYVRRYTAWLIVSLVAMLAYAAAYAAMVSLIEPITSEVLLASPEDAAALALPGTGSAAADSGKAGGGDVEAPDGSSDLVSKFNLKQRLDDTYEWIKARAGVTPDEVRYFVPILFLLVMLLRSAASFVSGYSFQRIGLGVTTDLRNDLFGQVIRQSASFHAEHPSGELLSRVVNDVTVVQNAVSTRVLDLFQQSITLAGLLYLLLSTHLNMALICLLVVPVFVFPIARFGKGMRKTSHRSQERMADLSQLLSEAVRGHRVVKAFGMEEFEAARFGAATERHLRVRLRAQMLSNASGPVVESLAGFGSAAFLIYAGSAVRAGELTGALLVQFLVNLIALYDPIRKLNKVNLILQEAMAAVQRVVDILMTRNVIEESADPVEKNLVEKSIAFESVTFGYRTEAVLDQVDLEIRKGETVALVGPSGAGKSTMVSLLCRFFDPDTGRIAIDSVDLKDLSRKSLSSLVGMVTQEMVLFDDTIRNNIAYGQSDIPLERVREAAAAAYADDFVCELPGGYETRIGEAGLQLSGGQRQRLTIARAILKDPPILVLDEATSHLDSESEALVQKALENLLRGRTTVVIAHRLSTISSADRIVVLDSGRIVEVGSHEELLRSGGAYRRLHDLQFRS